MKKENVLLIVIVLVVGVLVGILTVKMSQKPSKPAAAPQQAAPVADLQQTIKMLEGIVGKDPANRNAWAELGHAYYDSDQPVKSIEAYDKALALGPDDPNILTDQGVMFRRMGWYDRAIDNFSKAHAIDPRHPQSLFNLGVVYRYDLQDFRKAKAVWGKFLETHPTGPGADQVRIEMQALGQLLGTGMDTPSLGR